MAKTKRRHLAAIAAKKDAHPVDGKNKCSPLPRQETDFQDEEGSWVHVRKQRIIIWIPPLPPPTQAPTQVEKIKQKETVPGAPAKRSRRISRKRSRTDSTADPKNVGQISRKRSKINSTPDTKNARTNIGKAILKVRSWQQGRILVGKDTNTEVSQNPLPLQLPRTKTAAVKKAVAQGASAILSHSTVHQDNEPKSGNKESIHAKDMACKISLQDSLQVHDGKVSQTIQKNQNSSRSSAKHKCQRRETEMNNATKGDMDNCLKPKEQEKMGSQLPLIKDSTSFGLERNHQNGEEAEAIRSSDAYPQESAKPAHLSPASLVPSDSRLLDHVKLEQRSPAEFDRSMVGPSIFSKISLEQGSHEYDPRFIPSLQCASVGLFRNGTILANERIPSAAMHWRLSQENSAYMSATRESNFFGSDNFVNTSVIDNQSKRLLILRKNLAKEGGLRRWLVSKGLVRFVEIFEKENVDEFCLLQLTMATLKEMGAHAVGPRRKLIHAIDCLSQPYHFRAF